MRTPLALAAALSAAVASARTVETDICIYGGTSAAVIAGVQASLHGKRVVIVSPETRLGGLSSGGLGQTDIGDKRAIGGLARGFYERIARHYAAPEAWNWQTRQEYRDGGQSRTEPGETAMWTFEPKVAAGIFETLVREHRLEVLRGERLDLSKGVTKQGPRIVSLRTESGLVVTARVFIDATYEGDLMAEAGVRYRVGREANAEYGETLNGVQTALAKSHQLPPGVSAYRTPGDPSSGLLRGVDPTGPGDEGSADHRVQAYNFRMCLTDHPDNRIPFPKPEGYDEADYEILFRAFATGFDRVPWYGAAMPNRKTDTNNWSGFSTDYIGANYAYPDADHATRERIVADHRRYQMGLAWTLANHPRVPESVRQRVSKWGLPKDEFTENGGWPTQLYVREARRMVGNLVMTQHHCEGRQTASVPVGMGAYGMDSHNTQRHVDAQGHVRNEGDVQVKVPSPYPVGYGALTPREDECSNLLVPVCLSATHIAYGSIRMEPVFMVLGQSAATAAAHALDEGTTVQRIDPVRLEQRLRADGQVLEWVAAVP